MIKPGLRDGSPEEASLSPVRLERARDLAASFVEHGDHPALVVLVARHGVIALHEAFGRLGPEPDDPPLPRDALFPLASLAKPLTATALMMLVEEGTVGLTRRVSDYIPEFQGDGKSAVYVHHLLTHTSGIRAPDRDEFTTEIRSRRSSPGRNRELNPVLDTSLHLACERSLSSVPGEAMLYDDFNYELLGEIVRRMGGRPLEDIMRERVFAPLGMADSCAVLPKAQASRAVRAMPESELGALIWGSPVALFASGSGRGFHSTARDMAVFGQAFLDGGRVGASSILAPNTIREMTTNQIPGVAGVMLGENHEEASWGYGWGIACHEKWNYFPTHTPGTFQHSGWSGVHLWCDPTNDVVGTYFSAATREIDPDNLLWQADLFVNAVNAAVED